MCSTSLSNFGRGDRSVHPSLIIKINMCNCKNVQMGSFENQIQIRHKNLPHPIWVDACIAEEVISLLSKGVKTVASCCGHNKAVPSIAVAPESVRQMEDLGYKHHPNPCVLDGLYSRSFFYARSVKCPLRLKIKLWLPYLWCKYFRSKC